MNFRNRWAVVIVRTLLGLMFVFSGVGGFMSAMSEMKGVPEAMMPTMKVLWDTGIFQMIKLTEIVAGLMLIFGFLPQLGAIFLAPVSVGIIVVNSRIAPENLALGVAVALVNVYLGYAYWDKYKTLFDRK